ncbi:hypothetical protein ABH940_006697 [Streptacidiphilus sp. BW17]|uniref:hypothetical protein n=1 Tax=Streptacidiphilus sp. BW17 TaxID=3156274 RepID=UPI0035195877
MLKLGKTKRAIAMAAATLAIAGGATITATGSASAASGGGCRAWFDYNPYGQDVQVRPCISASGNTINGSGYLNGLGIVDAVQLRLINETGSIVQTWQESCSEDSAQDCTVADNMSFGWEPTGHTYYVEMFTSIGGNWYGPIESPALHT